MVREDRSEAGVSEVSGFHVNSDFIPRVGPRARVLLLGVRMCRGDNIDAAHGWSACAPVGFPRSVPGHPLLLLGVRMCRGDNIDAAHDWNARVPVGFGFFTGRACPSDVKHKEAPRVSLVALVAPEQFELSLRC